MFSLDIPGYHFLQLENIVLDYNGTIACDGQLLPGVAQRLQQLKEQLTIYVITADTFGTVTEQVKDLAQVRVLQSSEHREEKRAFIEQLGSESVVAIGNGRNDVLMLQNASLGIAVCQSEGAAAETLQAADVVCNSVLDALDLLRYPKRLLATLRA